jgi:hypothetical protein
MSSLMVTGCSNVGIAMSIDAEEDYLYQTMIHPYEIFHIT